MLSSEYVVVWYRTSWNGSSPPLAYIESLPSREQAKIERYLDLLCAHGGHMDEPLTRKMHGTPFREFRVQFGRNGHRLFYFAFVGRRIVILHGFRKTTQKTPPDEISRGLRAYHDFIATHH